MKTAIIAIAKCEELYIKEWIDYHLNLNFDTIIIADNDDTLVLSGYASDRVIIEDYSNVEGVQVKAYSELFDKYRNQFDWLFFIDIDEFLVIEDGSDVKTFLSSFPQDKIIRLSWKVYGDNDLLDVVDDDYSVVKRFTKEAEKTKLNSFVKSFIPTNIPIEHPRVCGHSIYSTKLKAVNALGERCINYNQHIERVVHKKAWVNHYMTKTIGEYIRQKYNRGGSNNNPNRYKKWEEYFFKINKRTQEKVDYANKLIEKQV